MLLDNPEWSQLAAVGRKVLPQTPEDSRRFIAALEVATSNQDLAKFAFDRLEAIKKAVAEQRATRPQ